MYRPGPAQNQGKNPAYGIQPLRALPVVPPQNNYQYENNAKQTFYQQHWKQLNPKAKKKRCTCCCICCSFFLVIIVIAVLLFLWAKCDLACTKVKRYSLDPNIESGFKLANDDHAIQNDEYDTVKVLNKRGDLVVNPSSDDFKNMYIEPDSETQFAVNLVSSCAFTSSELKEKMDLPTEPKDGNTFEMEYIKSGKGYYDKCFCRLANLYLTFAGSETEDTDISLDHIYGDIVYSRNSTEDYTNHFKSISTTNVNGEIKVKSGVSLKSKGDVNFEIKSPEATVTSIVNGIVTSNDILIENGAEIIANGKFTVKSQSPRGDIEISGAVKASSAEVSVSQSLTGTSHFNDGGFIEICPKNISGDLACHSNIESFTNSGKKSQSVSVVSERHEYSGQDFPPLVRVQGDVGLIEVSLVKGDSGHGELQLNLNCSKLGGAQVHIYELSGDGQSIPLSDLSYTFKDSMGGSIDISKGGVCGYDKDSSTQAVETNSCKNTSSNNTPSNVICLSVTRMDSVNNKLTVVEEQ